MMPGKATCADQQKRAGNGKVLRERGESIEIGQMIQKRVWGVFIRFYMKKRDWKMDCRGW